MIVAQRLQGHAAHPPHSAARLVSDALATLRRLGQAPRRGLSCPRTLLRLRADSAFYGAAAVGAARAGRYRRVDPSVKAAVTAAFAAPPAPPLAGQYRAQLDPDSPPVRSAPQQSGHLVGVATDGESVQVRSRRSRARLDLSVRPG